MAILPLLAIGLMLCLLFVFKSTRPLAWTLLAVGTVAFFIILGYWSMDRRQAVTLAERRALAMQHAARAEARSEWLRERGQRMGEVPVDLDALFRPRIDLGERPVPGEAPHPAAHADHPAEVTEDRGSHEPSTEAEEEPSDAAAQDAEAVVEPPEDPASEEAETLATNRPNRADDQRPSWVDQTPPREAGRYPVVVVTDPFTSKHEADRQVSQLIMIATADVVSDLVGNYPMRWYHEAEWDHSMQFNLALDHLQGMELTPGELRNQVWRDEYVEHLDLDLPSGPMLRVHTLLEFDEAFQAELQQRWQKHQARERLGTIGVIAASVLGLLAVVWGVLKFDTATKGYYTKWLLGGAAVAGLAVLAFFFSVAA